MLRHLVPTLAVLAVAPLAAQEQPAAAGDAITVTATRLDDDPFAQPYAFYTYDRQDLDQAIGRTALDRINYGSGVFIQHTAPNQTSPFIRGLTGEQSLLLVDGVRLSHAMMRPGPNQYAAMASDASLERIDVILGSSSLVNGSDGLTGALDFRLARAGRGVDGVCSPWVDVRVDSANGAIVQLGTDGVRGDFAYSVEVDLRDFHDRVGGKDFTDRLFNDEQGHYEEIPNTAYDQWSISARTAYTGFAGHRFEANAGHTRQNDAPRPDGFAANTGKSSKRYRIYDQQAFTYLHLRDRWQADLGWLDDLTTTLSWHRHHEEMRRASIRDSSSPPDAYLRQRSYEDTIDSYGLDLQARTYLADDHEITWGLSALFETTDNSYRELRTSDGTTDPAQATPYQRDDWANKTSVSDGAEYRSYGIYAQDSYDITEELNLLVGLRYSLYEWSFGDVDGDTDDITGSLRGTWSFHEHMNVFLGASKAFRAPNLKNLDGAVDRGSSGQPAVGNPDLDAEVSYTGEAGWRFRHQRDELALTAFYTRIDDLIQRDFSGPGTGEFTNAESGTIYGAEASWDYGLPLPGLDGDRRLALVGSASLVDAVKDIPQSDGSVEEDNISRANRLYGNLALRYDHDRNYWAKVQTRWHDAYDDVATDPSDSDASDIRLTVPGDEDGRMPGYAVLDLSGGWVSNDARRSVMLFVENLLDKTYRAPGSGADGAGRNVGLEGQVRF